jgi:hypothetical protein
MDPQSEPNVGQNFLCKPRQKTTACNKPTSHLDRRRFVPGLCLPRVRIKVIFVYRVRLYTGEKQIIIAYVARVFLYIKIGLIIVNYILNII